MNTNIRYGWAGKERPDLIIRDFDLWSTHTKKNIGVKGLIYKAGIRSFLWEIGRKVIGGDSPNYPQQSQDCVAMSAKNAIEYVQYYPIANGMRNKWTRVFPPYLYGCSRVFVGKGELGLDPGSIGSWQAQSVKEYGTIPINAPNCPEYSQEVADDWGYNGPPKDFIEIGKKHIVKAVTPVLTWEDLVKAVSNNYPVTVASDVGFTMLPEKDGFHHSHGQWPHSMCIIGIDDDSVDPYAAILNSWGPNVHGEIKDFKTGEVWPGGTLRVRKKDVIEMLASNDSFAYSSTDLFVEQPTPNIIFDLW